MSSFLTELLGGNPVHPATDAPATPQEAATERRDQHDPRHPLVGNAAAPTPPPTQPTYDAQLIALGAHVEFAERHTAHLAEIAAVLAEVAHEHARRDADLDTLLQVGAGTAYTVVATQGRPFNRLLASNYATLSITPPGQGSYSRELIPGWNTLDVPDGTRLAAVGSAFAATLRLSYAPTMTPAVTAASGSIIPAAATTNAGADTPVAFPVAVGHWVMQNNTTAAVGVEMEIAGSGPVTATAGSLQIPAGQMFTSDVPVSTLHLFTASGQAVNGTSAGNIVIRGWA